MGRKNTASQIFKTPLKTYFIQGFFNILLTSIFLLFPLMITAVIVIIAPIELKKLIAMIGLTSSLAVYTIMYKYTLESTFEPKLKFYKKFKTYFLRKHMTKSINCPNCNGKVNDLDFIFKDKKLTPEILFKCNSCKSKFLLDKVTNRSLIIPSYRLTLYKKQKLK